MKTFTQLIHVYYLVHLLCHWKSLHYYKGQYCSSCWVDGVCRTFGERWTKECTTYECRSIGAGWTSADVVQSGKKYILLSLFTLFSFNST